MDFRYQYRESKLSETVSIELEARTGTVRYVHNSSKAEAVNKTLKLKTPSELLQHARPGWIVLIALISLTKILMSVRGILNWLPIGIASDIRY